MADNDVKQEELKFEKKKKEKGKWGAKKIVTTVIIAALALLMIGGLYYIIIMFQQSHDDSNVFGYYDGTPIKYEANTVFYNTLMSDTSYADATASGDWSAMWSSWYSAYRNQVVYTAVAEKAKKAGIEAPEELVNRFIIDSGVYAGEDSSFDEEVYKSTSEAARTSAYSYMKKIYPYSAAIQDMNTALLSKEEMEFVGSLAGDTRSFEYFAVDYNAYPDELAAEYDISSMEKAVDEEGNEVEPSLSEIKQYIYSNDPDLVTPYIAAAVSEAESAALEDFAAAAEKYGNGIVNINNAVINKGGAAWVFNGIEYSDGEGHLAAALTDSLYRELYTEEEGHVTSAVPYDGGYVIARISSTEPDDSMVSFTQTMFGYYASQAVLNDLANEVLSSDKFEDNFSEKFFSIMFGNMMTI